MLSYSKTDIERQREAEQMSQRNNQQDVGNHCKYDWSNSTRLKPGLTRKTPICAPQKKLTLNTGQQCVFIYIMNCESQNTIDKVNH